MAFFLTRIAISVVVGAGFAVILTHMALTLMDAHEGMKWPYYVAGFFCAVPYFMKFLAKQCLKVDHVVDLFGMVSAAVGYAGVLWLWSGFLSNPKNIGLLHKISGFVRDL